MKGISKRLRKKETSVMAELFKDFTNLYPVSKTLRFELIPEGETLHYLEKNGVLEKLFSA